MKEPEDFGADSEYRRQDDAVQATLKTIREKRGEAGFGQVTQACVKIKETVAICI